jgi:hypothetical protein
MKSMHTIKETDMIAAKLDLLIKKMEEGSKQQTHAPVYAMGSHFTCEVCGNDGHSGNDCPETREDCTYLNNNNNRYHPLQGGQGGTSHVHHSREVTTTILLLIRISIRTNLP